MNPVFTGFFYFQISCTSCRNSSEGLFDFFIIAICIWVTHNGKNYFGYKNYVKAYNKTKIITAYSATTANLHDSQMIDELLNKREDGGQPVNADIDYRSEAIKQICRRKNIESRMHEKGYPSNTLTKWQLQRNRMKSKTRSRIEHIFGFMVNSMNQMHLH
jgi:hypothetical protein